MDTLIKIKVKMNQNQKLYEISILKHDTIKKLKEEVEQKTSIPVLQQNLVYNGKVLKDENKLNDYEIDNDAIITLVKKPSISDIQNQQSNNLPINNNNIIDDNNQFKEVETIPNIAPLFSDVDPYSLFNMFFQNPVFRNVMGKCDIKDLEAVINDPIRLQMISQIFKNQSTI